MPLHPKIDTEVIHSDGKLLSTAELHQVSQIETFVESIQAEAQVILLRKKALQSEQEKNIQLLEDVRNPFDFIDKLIIPQEESCGDYAARVIASLLAFKQQLLSPLMKDFIQELVDQFSMREISEDTRYETFFDLLNEQWIVHQDDAQDPAVISKIEAQLEETRRLEDDIERQEVELQTKISTYQRENNYKFELDQQYQLVKISKHTEAIGHSVLYVQNAVGDGRRGVILYRGDASHMLGQGGFGKVKLCQDIHTGEWLAIKIQDRIMKQASKAENNVLGFFGHFGGEALRDKKYYTVQRLLPGIDLGAHLAKDKTPNLADRLEIAIQAAALVADFHNYYLHRDLKPENFIWDDASQSLFLCDFGMASKLEADQDSVSDLSGSGTFLAPEIDASLHSGEVEYSKKSDLYALGHVFAALFEMVEDVPQALLKLIEHMSKPNVDERLDTADLALAELREIKGRSFSPTSVTAL
jgi:hypothetical protein